MKTNKAYKSLGELEAEIMEIIWRKKSASVREVLAKLKRKRKVAYTTVMTVMSRLHDKGILRRKLDKTGAYIYLPVQDKVGFYSSTSKKVINSLIKEFGEVAVAQFIDVIESSDLKSLEEWKRKLKKL